MSELPRFDETLRRRNLPPVAPRKRVLRVVYSPDEASVGRCFDLDGARVVLGREGLGAGAIADPRMSREHFEIRAGSAPHELLACDLGTRNGTFVDGEASREAHALLSGTVISVGDTLMVVDQEPDPDSLPAAGHADDRAAHEVVGVSFAARRLRASLHTAANARGSVLLLGATGTGKEVAARAIHRLCAARSGGWVPVNCAAIPPEIAEAELFGHRKGAFTGATGDRDGLFVEAHGGTLFLDEVGDLPLPLQAKLLRALEDGSIQPIGGQPLSVDTRVIAATHVDLEAASFRKDLYARLGDWVLHIPSLSERRSDILVLWKHFLRLEAEASGAAAFQSTPELAEALLLHSWPMNVRELAKLARRVASMAPPGTPLDLHLLPEQLQGRIRDRGEASSRARKQPLISAENPASLDPFGEDIRAPELPVLEDALRSANGNVSKVAEILGTHRTQVYRWLRRRGLDADRYR
ncbi:MAG: sigma 54-interacting transcriptional regulator [Deltaproteobacteria bacterium]|nr:sigma 54-interacting transcriptional regulator [Deltaproteobacteria bacterium]